MLDAKTLSMVIGVGNLTFALLTTLYIHTLRTPNRALETWRWAKLIAGSGFISNLAHSLAPDMLPAVLGNSLFFLGSALELAAYCLLFERRNWQYPLAAYAIAIVLALQTISFNETSENPRLVLFSLAVGIVYTSMALTLASVKSRESLPSMIACIDGIAGLLLFTRTARGMFYAPIVRFANDWPNLAIYLIAYISLIVNGFGFLLLAKQMDDAKLRKAVADLEEAEADQRQLLSVASHEFRTPAAIIKASLDSLKFLDDRIPAEVKQRLTNINQASQRLNHLSNRLIAHDRMRELALKPKLKRDDLAAVARDVVGRYPPDAPLKLQAPETLMLAEADAVLLDVALHNLIDNALRYHADPDVPVLVSLDEQGDEICIRVADCGPGIPDGDKQRVFQRFYSGKGGVSDGLGLSIVQSVAHAHGGRITVRDNFPQGAILEISLPR